MSTISASTTSTTAYKVTADTTGTLVLQTGSTPTTAMTIDGSQNVGIGTSSPSYKLDVQTSAASGVVGRFVASGGGASGYMYSGGDFYLASDTSANTSIGLNSSSNYVRFWTNGNERARIDSSGNLLVGQTSNTISSISNKVVIANVGGNSEGLGILRDTTGAIGQIGFYNPNGRVGEISTNGSTTTYGTSSDYRLKHDIAPMTSALAKVASLKPVAYKWNADGSDGEGFIAHELAEVCPQAVTGEKDAVDADGNPVYQGIDTSFLVATLTAAIQELKAELDAAKADIATLKGAA